MAGSVSGLITFGTQAGPIATGNLDTNFSALSSAANSLNSYNNYVVDTGSANTMVVTVSSPQSLSLTAGLYLAVKVAQTNTGPVTLNVNALGAKSVVAATGGPVAAGEIVAGTIISLIYNGTSWQIDGLTNVTTAAPYFQITATEITAGVTPVSYAYPEYDLRRYGGVGDNSTDNATPLEDAVIVAAVKGGTIYIAPGVYRFSTFPSLNSKQCITFQGTASANSGATGGSVLCYTGTASPVITASAAQAIEFRDLQIIHNNASFSGTYIKYGSGASLCAVRNVFFGANLGSGCTHLDLDATQLFVADTCQFFTGNPSIKGQASSGSSYSNVVTFRNCEWTNSTSTPIDWGGESWTFDECTFEALANGKAGAFDYGSPKSIGMSFRSCWFGDVTASGGTWISAYANGLVVNGCRFGGYATTTQAISLHTCQGVMISGNSFDTFSTAINFDTASCTAVNVTGNYFTSVTNAFGNTSNAPADLVFYPNTPEIVLTQTFTATLTGMTGATTGSVRYSVSGKIVSLEATSAITGTSNVATMTLTGVPTALRPANDVYVNARAMTDNGALVSGLAQVKTDGSIIFGNGAGNYSANAFTTSGTKGLGAGFSLQYQRS